MQTRAVSKYNRISARKTRLVADIVRGQKVSVALDVLKFTPQKAARLIEKTLKSAVANAENNFSADKKDLIVSSIMVDEGPTLKRYRPRARGMANSIKKRTSHITIVVEGQEKMKKKKEDNETVKRNTSKVSKSEKKNGS